MQASSCYKSYNWLDPLKQNGDKRRPKRVQEVVGRTETDKRYHGRNDKTETSENPISEIHSNGEVVHISVTFRTIHWSNLNSTILVEDSNFGPITFGSGEGKL